MERCWDPQKLIGNYLQSYKNVICFDSLKNLEGKLNHNIPENKITYTSSEPSLQAKKAINTQVQHQGNTPRQPQKKSNKDILPVKDSVHDFKLKCGKSIGELFQKHQGEDIFIFGTGPSLLKINPDEYINKICFSINYAFEYMPNMDYYFCHVKEVCDILIGRIDNEKLILPETLVGRFYTDRSKIKYKERLETDVEYGYIYPIQDPNERNIERKHIDIEKNTRFFTWSTTTHSAIHVAAYMGAKNIYLIGMDYINYPSGKVHFKSMHDNEYELQDWSANAKHKSGDIWLAERLNKLDIRLVNLSNSI